MTKKYDVYALGNALVDTEIEVSDAFLQRMDVGKGLMTLVDEARQAELIAALADEAEPHKQTSGGSACNTVVATRYFGGSGYYACKVADDATGDIFVNDLTAAGVDTLLFDELRDSAVVVTNARGVFDRPLAEFVLGAVIAHEIGHIRHADMRTSMHVAIAIAGIGGVYEIGRALVKSAGKKKKAKRTWGGKTMKNR